MSRIDEQTVRHVALLARLDMGDSEIQRFTSELDAILTYVDKLSELNTEGVEPTSHSLRLENVFRPDAAQPSLTSDAALSNAPDREGDYFKVPPIIQEIT